MNMAGSLNPYHDLPVLSSKQIVTSGAQTRLTTLKTGPQNDDGPPKQAVRVKRLSSLERLVDYGTDDEDMVEGPSPLHTAASFIAAPRSQEATTEDTREGETTTTANDSVVKRESPTNNGPKSSKWVPIPSPATQPTIVPLRHTKIPTGPKALRDQAEAPTIRHSTLRRHRYDPNFAPTSSQLDTLTPEVVNTTSSVVKPSPRSTSSLSASAQSTNPHPSPAPTQRTLNPRVKSHSTVTKNSTEAPHYGQRPLQDDISIEGGYIASNYYVSQPLSTLGTGSFTSLPNPHGQWQNQYAHGSWEPYRDNSRIPPQGAFPAFWYEQGSQVSQGMPGIGTFMALPTLPHQGAGNPLQTSSSFGVLPYPSNSTTTIETTTVAQYSLPIGVDMSQEIQPQLSTSYGSHASTPFPPISTQSQFPNYQGPVPPPVQQSVLKMELPPVGTTDPSNPRADVPRENPQPGHVLPEPTESSNTLPTPITPSVLQLPHPRPSSPPKGSALPTINDVLSPPSGPHNCNLFSRMQEVAYDSPDLASVLSEAESDGRPVVVRKFPLCTWWANTSLSPRNLQRILERPSQPCTGSINENTPPCIHLNAVTGSLPQAACLSCDLPSNIKFQTLNFTPHSPTNPTTGAPIIKYPCGAVMQDLLTHDDSNSGRLWLSTSTGDSNLFRYALHQSGLQPEALERGFVHLTIDQIREACTTLDVSGRDTNPEEPEGITVFVCEQQRGDIVITPARSWVQVSTNGEDDAASVSWMRFPLISVDLALRFELPVLHRLCIPETFHIKSMLYHHLKAHTTSPDTVAAPAFNFKDVVSLFDRLLAEEYIPITSKTACNQALLSCDFCGASLFISSWVCGGPRDSKDVCDRAEADISPKQVCCLCYVEGRKCACGHMIVQTSIDVDTLLELRNSFVSLVTPPNDTAIVPWILSTDHFLEMSGARLVGNGSLLLAELESSHDANERRKKMVVNGKDHKLAVVCSPNTDERHEVSPFSAIQCRGGPNHDTSVCSDALCFSHLASLGFHSSAALRYLEFPEAFHYAHTQLAVEWLEWTKKSWSLRGWANEQSYNLACIAQIYRKCKPRSSRMRAGFYDTVENIQGDNTGAITYSSVSPDECLPYVIEIDAAHQLPARDKEELEEPEEKVPEQRGSRKRKSDVLDMEVTTQSPGSSPNPPDTPPIEAQQSVSPPIKRSRKRKAEDEEHPDTDSVLAGSIRAGNEQSRGSSVAPRSVASNTTELDPEIIGLYSSDVTGLDPEKSPTPETRSSRQKKAIRGKAKRAGNSTRGKAKGKATGKRTKKSTLAHSFTAEEMDSHSIQDDSSIVDDADKGGVGIVPPSSPPPSTPLRPTADDRRSSLQSINPPPPPNFSVPLLPTPPPNEGEKLFLTPLSGINDASLGARSSTEEPYDQSGLLEVVKALITERERVQEESERRRGMEQQLLREHEGRMQDRLELERLRDLSKGWEIRMPSLEEDNRKLLDLHYASQKKLDQVIKERDEIIIERDDLNKRNCDLHMILKDKESEHVAALANQERKYLDLHVRYERLLEKQDQDQSTPSNTSDTDLRIDTKRAVSLPATLPNSRATSGTPGFGRTTMSSREASQSFSPVRSRTSSRPPHTPDRHLSRSSHHSPKAKLGRPVSLVLLSSAEAETEGEEDEINMLRTMKQ